MTATKSVREAIAGNRQPQPAPAVAPRRKWKRKPKQARFVDALDGIPFLAAETGRYIAINRGLPPPADSVYDGSPDGVVQTRGRPPIRGAAPILEYLRVKLGITYVPGPNGSVLPRHEGGVISPGVRAAHPLLAPLLTPLVLTGHPPTCAWEACEREAWTMLAALPANVPACAEHAERPEAAPSVQFERALPDSVELLRRYGKGLGRLVRGH